ncbi:hypothetical protein Ancab_034620 [Ancistrocladus abbreviatus]
MRQSMSSAPEEAFLAVGLTEYTDLETFDESTATGHKADKGWGGPSSAFHHEITLEEPLGKSKGGLALGLNLDKCSSVAGAHEDGFALGYELQWISKRWRGTKVVCL